MDFGRHGSKIWKGMKWVLYAEIGLVAAGYYVWHKMNVNEEYRKHMHENHPFVLEVFYRTAEFGGIKDARVNDYRKWGVTTDETDNSTAR